MEWLSTNQEWVLLAFMIAEKIVKMSPTDKDDILLDVVIEGLTKMVKGNKDDQKIYKRSNEKIWHKGTDLKNVGNDG